MQVVAIADRIGLPCRFNRFRARLAQRFAAMPSSLHPTVGLHAEAARARLLPLVAS